MTILGYIVIVFMLEVAAVAHYCKPPVVFTWEEGCTKIVSLEEPTE
jgi:hypothetical protein